MDDQPEIVRIIDAVLTAEGYEVVTANGGDSAIRKFLVADPRPNVVLTDVLMPGMTGPVMIDLLLAIEPDLKVIFMSGYTDAGVVQRNIADKGFGLIAKPFSLRRLRQSIKEAIAGTPTVDPLTD